MLDVHPPHHATHTWRDFFIHIATIVVGLLIAVGLEQGVEWLTHRHETKETRLALREERDLNVDRFHDMVHLSRVARANLEGDLRIFLTLKKHPGTPERQLPGVIRWGVNDTPFLDSAWTAAKQSNALGRLPEEETSKYRQLYDQLNQIQAANLATWEAINRADAYEFVQSDLAKLTPAQINAEIVLIQDCLRSNYFETVFLENVARSEPMFAPGPSVQEIDAMHHQDQDTNRKAFAAAFAFNSRDREKIKALDQADAPLIRFTQNLRADSRKTPQQIYEEQHTKEPTFKPEESLLNNLGYEMLEDGKIARGTSLLLLNTELYPASSNAYDSLADAYLRGGEKKLAIRNYQKAIELDPKATESIEKLHKIQP